jgi:hypothetical protein
MITVYCFSGSGHSLAVSKELSKLLDCEIRPIDNKTTTEDTAVVVFPVYCQNIPKPVKRFLKGLEAKYVAIPTPVNLSPTSFKRPVWWSFAVPLKPSLIAFMSYAKSFNQYFGTERIVS